ncbi:hypothetical protein PG991_014383 [Apiospora marii]|uniref:Uncharacterized protein n=1 Tax=Apiospora marii TaxID=335849 RepID=A0ABR1R9K2_9PEZI
MRYSLFFSILALAGTGLCGGPRKTVPVKEIGSEPSSSSSPAVPAPTPTPGRFAPGPDPEDVEFLLTNLLHNTRARRKARKCNDVKDDGYFVNQTTDFLGQWRANTGIPGEGSQTEKQIMERLVIYQIVHETVRAESLHNAFPDNIIDQIRSIAFMVRESGALLGADPRVLEALDVILDDICADTGEAQVPARIQQIADVVLRGLSLNPQLSRTCEQTPGPACPCKGPYRCGIQLVYEWDDESASWTCECTEEAVC